jgi:hypothetical protein
MSHRTVEIDRVILSQLPQNECEAVGIVDLCRTGARVGTVRAALKRLLDSEIVSRRWDGTERYGRYLYWAA